MHRLIVFSMRIFVRLFGCTKKIMTTHDNLLHVNAKRMYEYVLNVAQSLGSTCYMMEIGKPQNDCR